MNEKEQSLACDLTAIPGDVREEHIISAPQLFQTVQEIRELSNGYAFRFLDEPGKVVALAKYIENERLCCPFFHFELEVKPNGAALWLCLTGAEGVKELLKSGLLESDQGDLKKLIRTDGDVHLDELVTQIPIPNLSGALHSTSKK